MRAALHRHAGADRPDRRAIGGAEAHAVLVDLGIAREHPEQIQRDVAVGDGLHGQFGSGIQGSGRAMQSDPGALFRSVIYAREVVLGQEVLALAFLIIASVTAAVRIGSAGRPNPAAWRGRGRSAHAANLAGAERQGAGAPPPRNPAPRAVCKRTTHD